jgi:death-on-curing protein
MITTEIIIAIHDLSIKEYGGSLGIRDEHLLASAIGRVYQTFDGQFLYQTTIEKAAAIGESLIVNHPFVDGNKRTGLLAILAVLEIGGLELIASQEEAYNMIISISTGLIGFDQIVLWLKANSLTR